ncbi:hypothetical protein M8J76_012047 [Diaphorina citri]|nr:hypothetical protein M8J76_012047 [Diaphorina citri]
MTNSRGVDYEKRSEKKSIGNAMLSEMCPQLPPEIPNDMTYPLLEFSTVKIKIKSLSDTGTDSEAKRTEQS